MNDSLQAPKSSQLFSDIVDSLIRCTMRAQRDMVEATFEGISPQNFPDALLNRRFAWLPMLYPIGGANRHFFDTIGSQASLRRVAHRTAKLTDKSRGIPASVQKTLLDREPIDLPLLHKKNFMDGFGPHFNPEDASDEWGLVQTMPTRISSLIKQSMEIPEDEVDFEEEVSSRTPRKAGARVDPDKTKIRLRAATAIVYDYLTVPEAPGTRAYALVALRNYLFETYEIVPDLMGTANTNPKHFFTVRDIEYGLSRLHTSFRKRYQSEGRDTPPPEGDFPYDALLRQYLAMRSVLAYWFTSKATCLDYLRTGNIRPTRSPSSKKYQYEIAKSSQLEKLPETGEIVNELWGLPIPIRGADTLFRGGLKFSTSQGLVVALHGGPGSGKTSVALSLAAFLAPFDIHTLFITPEESKTDLQERMSTIIPDEIRRLSIFPKNLNHSIDYLDNNLLKDLRDGATALDQIEEELFSLANMLKKGREIEEGPEFKIPKPCNAIVVLDGLHDLFVAQDSVRQVPGQIARLYKLIATLKNLKALVIVTTGIEWEGEKSLDYLVDVAMHLSHESVAEYAAKPDRRIKLTKARHQLNASGTHGLQIAGHKGVRLSPQINYQLDRRAIWKMQLPHPSSGKSVLSHGVAIGAAFLEEQVTRLAHYERIQHAPFIFDGSHVFINGQGSGGKAALALKLAIAPSHDIDSTANAGPQHRRKVLIVSFLYPLDYYAKVLRTLRQLHRLELGQKTVASDMRIKVIHLYPGHIRPNDLYNKIEWELESAELYGEPYTAVIIDGLHNVFVQFPEIVRYSLFWPQLFNSLRSRSVLTITTHTILRVPHNFDGAENTIRIDDARSEPLRNALVQKTDFQLEVSPYFPRPAKQFPNEQRDLPQKDLKYSDRANADKLSKLFAITIQEAVGQPIPQSRILWSRESYVFFNEPAFASQAD